MGGGKEGRQRDEVRRWREEDRVRTGEKWMTEKKMETKTFAELRVVALWPDRQEMDLLTEWEITPRGAEDFLLNSTV